jgi:ABC-type glycerol-3-phosphate transport system substrate-binding protein
MRFLTRFLAVTLLVSGTWILGPTADAATTPEPAKPTFAFPTENVTIEVWWHEYAPFTAYVKELIEAYKKLRPNVTINPTIASSTDMNQKLTASLAAGTGPDIMDQDASTYVAYYTKGVLDPVNLDVFALSGQLDEPLHQ